MERCVDVLVVDRAPGDRNRAGALEVKLSARDLFGRSERTGVGAGGADEGGGCRAGLGRPAPASR
jgi:hypothetical protein